MRGVVGVRWIPVDGKGSFAAGVLDVVELLARPPWLDLAVQAAELQINMPLVLLGRGNFDGKLRVENNRNPFASMCLSAIIRLFEISQFILSCNTQHRTFVILYNEERYLRRLEVPGPVYISSWLTAGVQSPHSPFVTSILPSFLQTNLFHLI